MIEELYIRDLGVIKESRLNFTKGLTVLTGETGAGKTMVLTALGLLLGERADAASIRAGQQQTFVEGRWQISSEPIIDRVTEAGAAVEDGELILNRSVNSEGRSKASVGGRATPIALLTELGEQLVVVHGQAEQLRLKTPQAQREALDQFAGAAELLALYREAYDAWQRAMKDLSQLLANADSRVREAEILRSDFAEVERIDPKPNEDQELADVANRLTNIEALQIAAQAAHDALSSENFEGSADALGLLAQAVRTLETAANQDTALKVFADRLSEASYLVKDVAGDIAHYLSGLDSEDGNLDAIQERRSQLNQLVRKHGSLAAALEFRATASDRLLDLDASDEKIDELNRIVSNNHEAALKLAAQLSELRSAAAKRLSAEVSFELKALAMADSELIVEVNPLSELQRHGADNVNILLRSYSGAEPRPIGKGASGGELSRIMLAIEVVLAQTEQAPTFIFDEVDAGVGGASAIEVGRRLARLAKQAQVIVVTHLAQVAAFADNHLRVLKTSEGEFTATSVVNLQQADRLTELARMLSGLADSESAISHAGELLELARS